MIEITQLSKAEKQMFLGNGQYIRAIFNVVVLFPGWYLWFIWVLGIWLILIPWGLVWLVGLWFLFNLINIKLDRNLTKTLKRLKWLYFRSVQIVYENRKNQESEGKIHEKIY